jgi:mono/diheme cytochrome c family protein
MEFLMRTNLRWALYGAVGTVAAAVAVIGGLVWIGAYNVSALSKHWGATEWLLEVGRHRSIVARANASPPSSLEDPERLRKGIDHFHGMCRLCHGAPGFQRAEFAHGLYPSPPELTEPEVQHLGPSKGFWIVKHGLKLTGMPAFGPTHSEEDLWNVTAVLLTLPKLSREEYARLVTESGGTHEHRHAPGASAHGG